MALPTASQRIVFQEYVRAITHLTQRLAHIEKELQEQVKHWRLAPLVAAYQALRGVQFHVAVTIVAESGDLTRFDNPHQLMAYVGLHPSEHSSGNARWQGGIAKSGNAHARRVLVEGAWAYRYLPKVSRQIQVRQQSLPEQIRDIAWKAQLRLCKRFRRLIARGKHPNVAVTAGFPESWSPSCGPSPGRFSCPPAHKQHGQASEQDCENPGIRGRRGPG